MQEEKTSNSRLASLHNITLRLIIGIRICSKISDTFWSDCKHFTLKLFTDQCLTECVLRWLHYFENLPY